MKKILKICITLSFTFLLTGCVDCLVSLNYSKIKKPTLYGELTIEPQILEKYSMSISQIKKQLLDYDFFKDWTIKKQTDSSLSIESPTSFIKEISTLTKQNNKYILSIDIPKNMLDTSELNHYKNTLQLLNSSNATCSFKITMPGTIISSNVGKYQQNVVTINLFELFIEEKALSFHIISKKENNHIVELMKSVPEDKTMILVATGSLVGEGFDLDRLDTLFLAMPVASSSVIEQFTGRIHRLYDKKDTILVYDYVDVHIPMFDRMYGKRLKAYKKSGYELISDMNDIKNELQISQSIFDASNYYDMYSHDLMRAKKNIVVSSPSLSGDRVVEFTKLVKDKMEDGVEVTIVSWMPDKIRFGSSNYRMQLLEEMRQSGFYLKSAEDNCEHFAIIDQEIVWYGNINLLGKQDVEDHIMRIQSKEIANELMEMTFGNSLYNYLNNF